MVGFQTRQNGFANGMVCFQNYWHNVANGNVMSDAGGMELSSGGIELGNGSLGSENCQWVSQTSSVTHGLQADDNLRIIHGAGIYKLTTNNE